MRKSYETKKGRPVPGSSITSFVRNQASWETAISQNTVQKLKSDNYIVMDTEMVKGVGHWAREWNHVEEVFAIKFTSFGQFELFWSVDYILMTEMTQLLTEWLEFTEDIDVIWYYAKSRCDEIRMKYLTGDIEASYHWMDAQTNIAMKLFTTKKM